MLLSSLPKSYDTLIIALEVRNEDDLRFTSVQQKLIAEYERRGHAEGGLSSETLLKVIEKGKNPNMTCFFCKKRNHIKRDCGEYKKWLGKKQAQESKNKSVDKVNSVNSGHNDFIFSVNQKSKDG